MKAQAEAVRSAAGRQIAAVAPVRAAMQPPSVDTAAAANDEVHVKRNRTPLNPLWVINIAMAAFFIVAALVMMIS